MDNNSYYNAQRLKQMQNLKYRKKYERLKRIIKSYVFENAALCDQISQIQENITILKEERRFLLTKLIEYESDGDPQAMPGTAANSNEATNPAPKKVSRKRLNPDGSIKTKSKGKKQQTVQPIVVEQQGPTTYPINLGNLIIHSLGEIIPDKPNFHTENWIYPLGFTSTRVYAHPKEPERKCTFTCKILDNFGVPQFQIIPEADFDHVFFGETANICHLGLLEAIIRVADVKTLPLRPQGEIFFGLGHPTVTSLLQASPNTKKCANFKAFQMDTYGLENETDPTLNFDALQKLIAISAYHTVPEIKEEPPDELLEE